MTISFSFHWASFRKPWHIFLASIMPCRVITMAPNFPLAQERWVNERHPLTLSNQNNFSREFCVYVRTSILTSKLPPFHTLPSWLFLQFIKFFCVCSWMKAHKIHPIEREWKAEKNLFAQWKIVRKWRGNFFNLFAVASKGGIGVMPYFRVSDTDACAMDEKKKNEMSAVFHYNSNLLAEKFNKKRH